ncbi:hypothetical protein GJ697_26705 [Pseudoduganella sp. FT25W]|jgi:hypothetical protein|uniref:Uncharacterized protein n=1 Tax=Duganella alba TaxID=2666081 RepID=A0A6L5QNP1_9BURK|nr:hypothetical protein [Duganella alba]MRX11420.1 hypothetical protein [Duganella alba]MRX19591.1 hypothetical protein [Duganella alba]
MTWSRRLLGLLTLAAGAAVCLLALVAGLARASAAADWPGAPLPDDAESFRIGPRMTVDGTPMQLQGFQSPQRPEALVSWFRAQLPPPLLENTVNGKLVLGHPQGNYFITIQLAASGQGTRGVVAVSDLRGAMIQRAAGDAAADKLLAGFPAGTQVVGAMNATEQARSATFVALVNRYSEEVNRERLVELLQADGLRLERAAQADPASEAQLPSGVTVGSTLFFRGDGKEATAVITRGADNQVTVVLNTVTHMEQFQ